MSEIFKKSPMLQRIEVELAIGVDDFRCGYGTSEREGSFHHWSYDGPLEDVIDWAKESFDGIAESWDPGRNSFRVDSRIHSGFESSRGPDREGTWRYHLGSVLLNQEARADLAMPGETLGDLQDLLAGYYTAGGGTEISQEFRILQDRWQIATRYEKTYVSMPAWIERLARRG